MCFVVLTTYSIKKQQVLFFEILLEKRNKFNNTNSNTQNTGMLFKMLLLV
jgi:hypothetical protein